MRPIYPVKKFLCVLFYFVLKGCKDRIYIHEKYKILTFFDNYDDNKKREDANYFQLCPSL